MDLRKASVSALILLFSLSSSAQLKEDGDTTSTTGLKSWGRSYQSRMTRKLRSYIYSHPAFTWRCVTETTAGELARRGKRIKFTAQRHSKTPFIEFKWGLEHISVIFQGCTWTSIVARAPRAARLLAGVSAVQLQAWVMRKRVKCKEAGRAVRIKVGGAIGSAEMRGAALNWNPPAIFFAVELCLKFKWKVSVVVVPLTRDKGDY